MEPHDDVCIYFYISGFIYKWFLVISHYAESVIALEDGLS